MAEVPPKEEGKKGLSVAAGTGIIIGSVFGGALLIIIVLALLDHWLKKRQGRTYVCGAGARPQQSAGTSTAPGNLASYR